MLTVGLMIPLLLSACGALEKEINEQQESADALGAQKVTEIDMYSGTLRISELMVKNGAVFQSSDGYFYDWIEVENNSSISVTLEGWSLERNGDLYGIRNGGILKPGEISVISAIGDNTLAEAFVNCKLASGDTVSLVSPAGVATETLECFETHENISIAINSEGKYESCIYPTPGASNTLEEYDRLNNQKTVSSPLIISEVIGKNSDTARCNTGYEDWIELHNVSQEDVMLSDYYLSDDKSEPLKYRLPEKVLASGKRLLVWCSGSSENSTDDYVHANFKICGSGESIYLSTTAGYADYCVYQNTPANWSIGREEDGNGWKFFTNPTPGKLNSRGFGRMAGQPVAITAPGCYDDVDSISVELFGEGTIRYTLDGTPPDDESEVYSEPIEITDTTIIRCRCEEEDLAPGKVLTLSYFLNEAHSLPVLSLVTDDFASFKETYSSTTLDYRIKTEYLANLSLYESGLVFTQNGTVSMKGWTSLNLPKKSMGMDFSGSCGDGAIACNLFGDGVNNYSSLSIRAGQDYTSTVIINELIQELCIEASDNVPTQHGKYCALYINGNYWGLYCLKEDVSVSYYANLKGTDKENVVINWSPIGGNTLAYSEFLQFCKNNDMSVKENYDYFCSVFDIENLIDWIIIEGFSANPDINGNMRYFRTTGGKWQIVLYDLDWSLRDRNGLPQFNNVLGREDVQICRDVIRKLIKNNEFSEALYSRAEELLGSVLSNEHVLEKIDELAATVEPELERDRIKWGMSLKSWYSRRDSLKNRIESYDWDESCLESLRDYLEIPQ